MRWVVRSDDLDTLKKETAKHYESSKYLLISGFLRYFKTTTILDWAIKTDKKLIYVVRTNMTTDESVKKVEQRVAASDNRQLVTLRGKSRICPRIRNALVEDTELPYELIKVKHCFKCPNSPYRKKYIKRELVDEINSERVINTPILEDYYKRGICPAEVVLIAAKSFNTIFMTYAWLEFVKDIGKGALSEIFKDSLLIMDEARHLEEYGITQRTIGYEVNDVRKMTEIENIDRILNDAKYYLDRMRTKEHDNLVNVDTVRETLKIYRNFLHSGIYGMIGDLPLSKENVWNSIFFLQNLLIKHRMDNPAAQQALEDALIMLMWVHKNIRAKFFFDFNKGLSGDKMNIYLTARRDKKELTDILDEAGKVFLVDSTPPPLEWVELCLGKKYDINMLEINPQTMPDIKIWVDGTERRWTRMYRDYKIYSCMISLVKGIVNRTDPKTWIISVRSRLEMNTLKASWGSGEPPTIIYQRGEESEGVQLEGNHMITGIQYQHPRAFNSQMDYVCSFFKATDPRDKKNVWERYLNEKSYQSFVQQMFRTYYYKRPCRIVLIGVSKDSIDAIKNRFKYLDLVHWHFSGEYNLTAKVREAVYLIKTGIFGSKGDLMVEDIKENYQGLSDKEIQQEVQKEYGRVSLGMIRLIMKRIGWL